jgi:hypothetical protein
MAGRRNLKIYSASQAHLIEFTSMSGRAILNLVKVANGVVCRWHEVVESAKRRYIAPFAI